MSFIYCQSCGTKVEYTSKRPNFCINCGESLALLGESKTSKRPDQAVEASQGEERCPNVSGIEVEVSRSQGQEVTLGSTLGSGALPSSFVRKPYEVKGDSVEQDSLDFCKSSKPKDIDESGKRG